MSEKPALHVLIAAPRGFCAGVDRAIRIVELAIEKYGAPVYVRHEIVHNRFVVDSLKAKGAIFVEELDAVPDGVPVIFSAHGVPKAVPAIADARGLNWLDATCPLVVQSPSSGRAAGGRRQAHHLCRPSWPSRSDRHLWAGSRRRDDGDRIGSDDVALLPDAAPGTLGFLTQTTLSVDDTKQIIDALLIARFRTFRGRRAKTSATPRPTGRMRSRPW
jgi:4-hydroxy-3-methylbut-2-enyl diphosphate reductase